MNHQMQMKVLGIFSVGTALDAVIMPPVSQPVEHHEFIDQRIIAVSPIFSMLFPMFLYCLLE